jgi:hypothetical protein
MSLRVCSPCEYKNNINIDNVVNNSKLLSKKIIQESYLLLRKCDVCHLMPQENYTNLNVNENEENTGDIRRTFAKVIFETNPCKKRD